MSEQFEKVWEAYEVHKRFSGFSDDCFFTPDTEIYQKAKAKAERVFDKMKAKYLEEMSNKLLEEEKYE
jgi:hypothetical protein